VALADSPLSQYIGRFICPEDLKELLVMTRKDVPAGDDAAAVQYIDTDALRLWWREKDIAPLILNRILILGALGHKQRVDVELFVTLSCALLTMVKLGV
jgi:hypothetical protein